MDSFLELIFQLLGGLGIFLLGMKSMSDGMQAVAGSSLRRLIGVVTDNRLTATVVGIFVTCVVQSSSITTVMVVGFVNSGVMALSQAIGVIMGANIGTTGTIWLAGALVSDGMPKGDTLRIAMAHTGVNLLMAITLLPFVHPIARFLSRLT